MSVCLLHDCFLYLSLCKLCSVDTSEEEAREGKEEKSLFFLLPPILSSFFLILPYSLWRGDQNHKLFFVCDWEVFFIIVSVPCIKHNVCSNPHVCARICVFELVFVNFFWCKLSSCAQEEVLLEERNFSFKTLYLLPWTFSCFSRCSPFSGLTLLLMVHFKKKEKKERALFVAV